LNLITDAEHIALETEERLCPVRLDHGLPNNRRRIDGDTERHCLRQGALPEKVLAKRLDFILLHFDIGFPGIALPWMDRSFEEYTAAEVSKLRNIKFEVLAAAKSFIVSNSLPHD
jgi:hypothetical protein